MNNIFVSTSCLEKNPCVIDVVKTYRDNGLKNIELGSAHTFVEKNIYEELSKFKDCNFIVHNYFPPVKDNIVLNFGIIEKHLLLESLNFILENLPKYRDIGVILYSFHAPYRIKIDSFNDGLKKDNIQNYEETIKTYFESLEIINEKAKKCGIKLAVENNEVAKSYLVNDKNELLTFAEPWEIPIFFPKKLDSNIGALLDIGHLKVASKTLNYQPELFVEKIKDYIFEIHINDNDGIFDQHNSLTKETLTILNSVELENKVLTLEIKNGSIKTIAENYEIMVQYFENRCNIN